MTFDKFLMNTNTDRSKLTSEEAVLLGFEKVCVEEEDYIQLLQLRYLFTLEPFVSKLLIIFREIGKLKDEEKRRAVVKITEYILSLSNKYETNAISSHFYAYFVTSFINAIGMKVDEVKWVDPRKNNLLDVSFSGNAPTLGYGGYLENRSNFSDISGILTYIKVDERVITIPNGIKEVRNTAFNNETGKRKAKVQFVTLPSSVNVIEDGTFKNLPSLNYVVLPSNIKIIKQGMFAGCANLKEIVAFGVNEISSLAFDGSSIETLRGFDTKQVDKVQAGAFRNCSKLTTVILPNTRFSYATLSGATSLKELAYKADPRIGMMNALFMADQNDKTPKCYVEKVTVTFDDGKIPNGYFQNVYSLKEITINGKITSIGDGAFMGCSNLEKINIQFEGNVVPVNAFKGCKKLISLPAFNNVDTVLDSAFEEVESLETLYLSNKVSKIGKYAFKDCKSLKNINFEYTGDTLSTGAFVGVGNINVSKLLNQIKVFEPYSAAGLAIPDGFNLANDVKLIATNAFAGCTFPEKFILTLSPNTIYEVEAFKDTNIKSLFYNTLKIKGTAGEEIELYQLFTTSIDEFKRKYQIKFVVVNVNEVPEDGFKDWEQLEVVGLAENLKVIGKRAFANCHNLKVVRNKAKDVIIEEEAFLNCSNLATIGDGAEEGNIDLNFAKKIALNAFSGAEKFISIKALEVKEIYPAAFYGCPNLASIEVSISKNYASQGFKLCSLFAKDAETFNSKYGDLKEIKVRFEDNKIPESFFEGLANVTTITIEGQITEVGPKAFRNCPELANLTVDYVGEVLPSYCFENSPKVDVFAFASKAVIFEPYSASNLTFPKNFMLSSKLKKVAAHAFENSKFDERFILDFASGSSFEPLAFKGTNVANLILSSFTVKNSNGDQIELYQVFEDDFESFQNNYKFPRVLIEATEIPDNAFMGWKNLEKIICGEHVQKIGASAFEGCENIDAIKFKCKDIEVGDRAFYNCQKLNSIKTYTNEEGEGEIINLDFMKKIGKEAFANCPSFVNIVARNVDHIDRLVFANCTNISEVHLKISKAYISSGYKFYEIFAESLEEFNEKYKELDCVEVLVDDSLNESFFEGLQNVFAITVVGELTSIGKYCFKNIPNLENLEFSYSGERIEEGTFEGLEKLESLPYLSSVNYVGDNAFKNLTKVSEISLSDKVIYIGKAAFKNCESLVSLNSELYMTKIEEETFMGCSSLCYVDLTNIGEIGDRAFDQVEAMTEIKTGHINARIKDLFPDAHIKKATYVGKRIPAFFYSELEELEEVEFVDLLSIGAYAFEGCKVLRQISDIDQVNYIGDGAFSGTALEQIKIPSDIEYLGLHLFEECSALVSLSIPLVDKKLNDMFSFEKYDSSKEVVSTGETGEENYFVPNSLTDLEITKFVNAGNFSGLDVNISLLEKLEDVPDNFLNNYKGQIEIDLSEAKHIGNYAFKGQNLAKVDLPKIEVLEEFALSDMPNLSEISIGKNIKKLPSEIFNNPNLVKVELENNDKYEFIDEVLYDVENGEILFVNKDAYGTIHIPDYVKVIRKGLFNGCNLIEKIFTNNVSEIEDGAFNDIEELQELAIENPLCRVGEDVLSNSNKLVSITIPDLELDGISISLDYYLEKCHLEDKINVTILSKKLIPGFLGKVNKLYNLNLSGCELREIPTGLFKNLEIENLILPDDIDRIEEKAFDNTVVNHVSSRSLEVNNGIIYLEDKLIYALEDDYPSLTIKEGTTLVFANAFERVKNISKLDLSKVKDINLNRVFANFKLEELIVDNTNINDEFNALEDSLTKLTYLGEEFPYSLSRFNSLREIELRNVKELEKNSLAVTNEVDFIKLPSIVTLQDYVFGSYEPNKKFASIKKLEVGPSIKDIGSSALFNASIDKLVIKDNEQFMMFRGVLIDKVNKEILFAEKDMPSSFEYIEELNSVHSYAFFGCKNLSNVVINVKNIGDKAFLNVPSLEKVIISRGLEKLGEKVFMGTPINTLQIPFVGFEINKPENVSMYLFGEEKNSLKGLYISKQKEFIQGGFKGLELETLLLSNEVEVLKEKTFAGLLVDHFVVPSSVETVNKNAFFKVDVLTNKAKFTIYVSGNTIMEKEADVINKVLMVSKKAVVINDAKEYQRQYLQDMQVKGFREHE